ncbi:ABC transporter [Streptococcus gordonii]|uniref:ABC transporter permease n=1 Tax=Streptococcus gordonii TaxID=1302 RepID=UPI001CC084B3|nr:ABC transporter permease [Streptococcus gordonii]MBZ2135557.1 ABC transporter [Streptococcus gordonii]
MKYGHSIINIIWSEFLILFRYKKNLISDIIIFISVYLGIITFSDFYSFSNFYNINAESGPILLLIGYIFWSFSSVAFGYSSSVIVGDSRAGMLEVKVNGIVPYYINVLCSVFVTLLESIIILFLVILISFLGNLINISSINFIIFTVLVSVPSVLGMYGMGLILGGMALKEKSIGQFVSIISTIFLFVSNTFILNLPNIIYIIPFTSGIDFIRKLYSYSDFDINLLIIYLVCSIFWFVVGVVIFNILLKKERMFGSFDSY